MTTTDRHAYGYNALGQRAFKPRFQTVAPGDADGDGIIDQNDLKSLRDMIKGKLPASPGADCNGDGAVDNQDTHCIARQIGMAKNKGKGKNSEPETATVTTTATDGDFTQVGWVLFAYDEAGRLIGEYDEAGIPIRRYVWLEDLPVAVISTDGIYYLHADHLNTPKVVTDPQGAVVWQADYRPFGAVTELVDTLEMNLRFPGQYHDRETGLHQNWHREYAPDLGRYSQSDPIGLRGGSELFAYANSNPLANVDPMGLMTWEGTGTLISASLGAGAVRYSFKLESRCVDGRKARVRVIAGGSHIGASYAVGFTHTAAEFQDSNGNKIDPFVFQGQAIYASVGYAFIGIAGSWSHIVLGDAVSRGWSYSPGIEATLGWGIGNSRVESSEWVQCNDC